jgi:hypothetical protein
MVKNEASVFIKESLLSKRLFQISPLNFQISALNFQISILNFQISTLNFQISTLNFQISTLNFQISALNFQQVTNPPKVDSDLHFFIKTDCVFILLEKSNQFLVGCKEMHYMIEDQSTCHPKEELFAWGHLSSGI